MLGFNMENREKKMLNAIHNLNSGEKYIPNSGLVPTSKFKHMLLVLCSCLQTMFTNNIWKGAGTISTFWSTRHGTLSLRRFRQREIIINKKWKGDFGVTRKEWDPSCSHAGLMERF